MEWKAFEKWFSATTKKVVGVRKPGRHKQLELSTGMLELVVTKHATHLQLLTHSRSTGAHVAYKQANCDVKAIVKQDIEAYLAREVHLAEQLQLGDCSGE